MRPCRVSLLLFLAAASAVAAEKVLVPGSPPLTEEVVGRFTEFFEWALDVQLTDEQRELVRQDLSDSWRKKDKESITGVLDTVARQKDFAQLSRTDRELVRQQLTTELIDELRKTPNDPLARWVLQVYESAHQPIAEGRPPLTRQSADAFVEVLCFMVSEALGSSFKPDRALKDAWAASLAKDYPGFSEEQKQQITRMPLYWAAVRSTWPKLPKEEQKKYRAQWGEGVKALWPQQASPAAPAEGATAARPAERGKKSAAELMRESASRHQAFMGMMNLSMQTHYTRMNSINALGGSPWRYEYRYW
ncbi:MAG: hypothetical protein HYZ28_06095 [Myxococcales bacterium]|nr:hypothetical protein [Myxococcales bacterium]